MVFNGWNLERRKTLIKWDLLHNHYSMHCNIGSTIKTTYDEVLYLCHRNLAENQPWLPMVVPDWPQAAPPVSQLSFCQKLELAICVPLTKMESNFDQNGLKLTTKTVFVTTISELFPDLLYYIWWIIDKVSKMKYIYNIITQDIECVPKNEMV